MMALCRKPVRCGLDELHRARRGRGEPTWSTIPLWLKFTLRALHTRRRPVFSQRTHLLFLLPDGWLTLRRIKENPASRE